jgi:hypothetical protein
MNPSELLAECKEIRKHYCDDCVQAQRIDEQIKNLEERETKNALCKTENKPATAKNT